MHQLILIGIGISIVAAIIYLIYYYSASTIILRTLKKLPYQRVGSLRTQSFSKIEGKALNIESPLIAPLSKRPCVFYKMKIEKKVKRGKSSHWKTLVYEEEIQDFFIEQNGERVVVFPKKVPQNYNEYLITDKTVRIGTFGTSSPEFIELLNAYNIEAKGVFGFTKSFRYTEAIVEVGERIVVAGNIKWMDLENPIADYNYSSIASIIGNAKSKIIITDTPEAHKPKRKL